MSSSYPKAGPFTDDVTPPAISAAFLNALETWLAAGFSNADIAAAAAIAISKLADPGTGKVIGSSGGAATAVNPPGFEIGYDQVTTAVTVSSTTESSGTSVIAGSAYTFDGSPVVAEFFSPTVSPALAVGAFVVISLFEGATQVGRFGTLRTDSTNEIQIPLLQRIRFTPTAGSHTYSVTAFESGGSATIRADTGGTGKASPAYLRLTKA